MRWGEGGDGGREFLHVPAQIAEVREHILREKLVLGHQQTKQRMRRVLQEYSIPPHSARVGTHERGAEHDLGVVLVHARAARELDAVVLDADLHGFGTDIGVKGTEFAIRVRILV